MTFLIVLRIVLLLAAFDYVDSLQMYLQATPTRTFNEAVAECKARGMQLAILNSQAAYDVATSYIETISPGLNNIWIGFRIKDVANTIYEWINGESTQFCPWGPNDPDYIAHDSCVRLLQYNPFKFADKECSMEYAFLCTGDDEISTTNKADLTTKNERTTTETITTTKEAVNTTGEVTKTTTETVKTTSVKVYTTGEQVTTTKTVTTNTKLVKAYDTATAVADISTQGVGGYSKIGDPTTTDVVETSTTQYESTTEPIFTTTKKVYTFTDSVYNIVTNRFTNTEQVHITLKRNNLTAGNDCVCKNGNIDIAPNHNYTFEELRDLLSPVTKHLRLQLLVDKTTLSAFINKHISKTDDRPSAKRLGYVGITFLIAFLVLPILADLSSWYKK